MAKRIKKVPSMFVINYCLSCWARYQKLVPIPNSRIYCDKKCASKFNYHLKAGDITYDEDGWPIIKRYIEKHCKYCMARYQKKVPVPVHKTFCNSQCRNSFGRHKRDGNLTYEDGVPVITIKPKGVNQTKPTKLAKPRHKSIPSKPKRAPNVDKDRYPMTIDVPMPDGETATFTLYNEADEAFHAAVMANDKVID